MAKREPFTHRDYTIEQITKSLSKKGVKFLPQSDDIPYRRVVISSAKNLGIQSWGMIELLKKSGFVIVKDSDSETKHHLSAATKRAIREAVKIKLAQKLLKGEGTISGRFHSDKPNFEEVERV